MSKAECQLGKPSQPKRHFISGMHSVRVTAFITILHRTTKESPKWMIGFGVTNTNFSQEK